MKLQICEFMCLTNYTKLENQNFCGIFNLIRHYVLRFSRLITVQRFTMHTSRSSVTFWIHDLKVTTELTFNLQHNPPISPLLQDT